MVTFHFSDDLVDLLGEAAVQIAKLESSANIVSRRLRAMQQRLTSRSTTVGGLAQRIDVSPRDVLDTALAIGVEVFWHDGHPFHAPSELGSYLTMAFHIDPLPELEFELTANQQQQMATEMGIDVESLAQALAKHTPIQSSDIEKLLIDAAVEIAVLDGTENGTFRRLLAELQNPISLRKTDDPESAPSPSAVEKRLRKFAPSDAVSPNWTASEKKQSGR